MIYSGSVGLAELLGRSDIDACVVDVHPSLFVRSWNCIPSRSIASSFVQVSVATKVWTSGKHCLAKSPIALTSQRSLLRYCNYWINSYCIIVTIAPFQQHSSSAIISVTPICSSNISYFYFSAQETMKKFIEICLRCRPIVWNVISPGRQEEAFQIVMKSPGRIIHI